MSRQFARNDLSLKGLEVFQIIARKGSLQDAAVETGLSVSTISHHLRNLEEVLGVELFNHRRRPMTLTSSGQVFLRNIEEALFSIRKAKAEVSAGNVAQASYLRLGTVEDLDSDIIPDLAVFLSAKMSRCDFVYHTDSSHSIIEMLQKRQLDLGITTTPAERLIDLYDRPLLRDPFVVILQREETRSPSEIVEGITDLPFLRFSKNLIVASQIESQLSRSGFSLPNRFECANNQTLMAMVSVGAGWTITTPLMFSRAKRFHSKLKMVSFPGKSFSRTLALVSTADCPRSILDLVDNKMRALITRHIIKPVHQNAPWLTTDFALIS